MIEMEFIYNRGLYVNGKRPLHEVRHLMGGLYF